MRVAHLFNMANNAYNIVKALRRLGIEAELIIKARDFALSLPHWEEGVLPPPDSLAEDLVVEITPDLWREIPSWIKIIDNRRAGSKLSREITFALSLAEMYRLLREYPLIQAHGISPAYLHHWKRPFIVYDAGWSLFLRYSTRPASRLALRAYQKADAVIINNINVLPEARQLGVKKLEFIPFVVDEEKYRPVNVQRNFSEDFVVFSPARLAWAAKGNDQLVKAFATFLKDYPNSKLLLVEWGPDTHRTQELVGHLGIQQKVAFLPPMMKPELVRIYALADVVADQFIVGGWGTTTLEAMSCGKPTIMYYDQELCLQAYGELPPIANARSAADILYWLKTLRSDESMRTRIGASSREWVIKHHNWRRVAEMHVQLYSSLHA